MGASFSTWQRSAGNHCNRARPDSGTSSCGADKLVMPGRCGSAGVVRPNTMSGRMLALATNDGQVTTLLSSGRGGHPRHLTKRRDELGRAALTAQQLPTTQAVGHQVTLGVAHPFDGLHVRCPWP